MPLYLGSTLICLPSLHVFSSYLVFRMTWSQTLVIGLCLPAVAALFSLGFAPILGFLHATMGEDAEHVSWQAISKLLLTIGMLAGIGQLWRCTLRVQQTESPVFLALVLTWHGVLLFVTARMADLLHLT